MAKLIKAIKGDKYKVKIDVQKFGGNLNEEELLDWIACLDNYFECEEIPEEQRVKIAKTKLKGHALIWWDCLQSERRKQGKSMIVDWGKMVAKLKGKFLPSDYQVQMFKKLQNLRQKEMDVKAYIEEFYRLSMRSNHNENEDEKIARYLGGLRMNIQDELSLTNPRNVEECYKMELKAEEKVKRIQEKIVRGKGSTMRGRGNFSTLRQTTENQQEPRKRDGQVADFRGGYRGTRGRFGGGRNSNTFVGRCYHCQEFGHPAWKCPKKASSSTSGGERKSDRRVKIIQEDEAESSAISNKLIARVEVGEMMMMKKQILKTTKEEELLQRKALFRIACRCRDKVCKFIVDSGCTDNIVSHEMVEKLHLQRVPRKMPYKVSWVSEN